MESPEMKPTTQYADGPEIAGRMAPDSYVLKRVGARPLSFTGSELCMAMSFVPAAPSWYEINVYRTTEQSFVCAIKLFYRDEGQTDVHRAWEFDDFGALMQHLETYDPAGDVAVEIAPDDPKLSLPEMAAYALSLRAKAAEARRQYSGLVGEILHELDAEG
jgi:hypothetical protein